MSTLTTPVAAAGSPTHQGPQFIDIVLAAATSITVATVGQGLTLQAVAGVTKELGQSTLDNLQSISNGAVLREMTDPLASLTDTTMGTSGVCTPNPYTGL